MLCQCLESPNEAQVGLQYVLKIVDPRFLKSQREYDHELAEPTMHTYRSYIDMVLSGTADELLGSFGDEVIGHDTEFELEGSKYSAWQGEAI